MTSRPGSFLASAPGYAAPVSEKRAWLTALRDRSGAARAVAAQRENFASLTRLATFVAGVALVYFSAAELWACALAAIVSVGVFVAVVRIHLALAEERRALDRLGTVIDESASRLGGAVVCVRAPRASDDPLARIELPPIADAGPGWELTPQEIDDLDLFAAPAGAFGLLNRASTAIGARRLRDALTRPMLDPQRIAARQLEVRTLADDSERRLRLMAACAALREEDRRLARFSDAVRGAKPLRLFAPVAVLRWASLVTAAVAVVASAPALAGQGRWGVVAGGVLVLHAVVLMLIRGAVGAAREPWKEVAWAAGALLNTVRRSAPLVPATGALEEVRTRLARLCGSDALPALSRRVAWAESGGLILTVLNLLALFELHVVHSIVKRAARVGPDVTNGLSALAELEMLLSLAAFAWEQPVATMPAIDRAHGLTIRGGVHPLVGPERVVANDVELSTALRVWVITGSNMAGKSTFLRMVGLNVLFAQVGGAACAAAMRWSPVRLITDLRVRDSLAASESYFLAEVRHLRRMIAPPAGDEPVLGLIDEPFRGTNALDQTAASMAVLEHLLESPHFFLVATHDRALTELADGGAARNVHFRENLGAEGMVFDYVAHAGPARTRNALRVLAREGYPEALVRRARSWLCAAGDGGDSDVVEECSPPED
ncbi:MAG: hypothetical protein AB7Q17_13780 [Phycisphaerae bacterium]